MLRNRLAWDRWAPDYAGAGLRSWAAAEPIWGIWGIAEAQARVFPADLGGDMIRLLRRCGMEVEDLLELRPPQAATASHPLATLDWARQWPSEEFWKARKLR